MSETTHKSEMEGQEAGRFRLRAFYVFVLLLSCGVAMIITGLRINTHSGFRAMMELRPGQQVRDAGIISTEPNLSPEFIDFDFLLTLDSLIVQDYEPRFEIQLFQKDGQGIANPHSAQPPRRNRIATFPMTPMEIHGVADTEYRFRLSNFYPNFDFTYTYPDQADTIAPRAPGIMLDLKTAEGDAIVTLRADQPGRHVLGDVVGFGAPLEFQWERQEAMINADSIHESRIFFTGRNRMVYFMIPGAIDSQALQKDMFYQIPGKSDLGFRLIHLFPDAKYLKAIPSTDGTELRNPVAEVQVWKTGQGYQEAFIYPGKTTGIFDIAGTSYSLGLDISTDHALQDVEAIISIESDQGEVIKRTPLRKHRPRSVNGYRLKLAGFDPQHGGQIRVQVSSNPGNPWIYFGSLILLTGLLFILFKRRILTRNTT